MSLFRNSHRPGTRGKHNQESRLTLQTGVRPQARSHITTRRGPPIRVGTKCGRGSTNLAHRAPEPSKQTDVPIDAAPKGFSRDVIALLGQKNTPDLMLLAMAAIGVLYETTKDRRTRGKLRSAFEAIQRDDRFIEDAVQGAMQTCSAMITCESRIYHYALEACAVHCANRDRWQTVLTGVLEHIHDDTLTIEIVVIELLEN